jgi:L-lactate utilization protein LutB
MSEHIQLELNFQQKTAEEMTLCLMQKQINEMSESMGKVRRKMFAELGEVKKMYATLIKEHADLQSSISTMLNQKTEWLYQSGDSLFEISDKKQAAS